MEALPAVTLEALLRVGLDRLCLPAEGLGAKGICTATKAGSATPHSPGRCPGSP